MPPQVITRDELTDAPLNVELGANDVLEPMAVFAHFDGTAASGAFLPCVTYYTQDGKVFARAVADEQAAGASADVSWFPGLSVAAHGATASTGLFYDIDNTGATLEVHTTGHTMTDVALLIQADVDDVQIQAAAGAAILQANDGDVELTASGVGGAHPSRIVLQAAGSISLESGTATAAGVSGIAINSDADLTLQCNGANKVLVVGDLQTSAIRKIGFYGVAPVNRAAHPVTLADVITLLTNVGLCS